MQQYFHTNLIILLVLVIALSSIGLAPDYILLSTLLIILLIPALLVHIIEEKDIDVKSKEKLNKVAFKSICNSIIRLSKRYIIKYLKSYTVFLIVLLVFSLLMYGSMLISFAMIYSPLEKSLGQSLILLFSAFIVIEGFSILLNLLSSLVVMEIESLNPFKAILRGKRVHRKKFFSHLISVSIFAIFSLPIIMLSDMLHQNVYLASVLRVFYLMLVVNYSIFDIKAIIKRNKDSDTLKPKKEKKNMFKKRK